MVAFEGEHYVILSVFEADGYYHANVGLEYLHRFRMPATREDLLPLARWHSRTRIH